MIVIKDLSLLEEGDELLVSSQSRMYQVKLLRKPKERTKKSWNGETLYATVKATLKKSEEERSTSGGYKYTVVTKEVAPASEHNCEERINLNYRDIILLNREI